MQESSASSGTFSDIFVNKNRALGRRYLQVGQGIRSLGIRGAQDEPEVEIPKEAVVNEIVSPSQDMTSTMEAETIWPVVSKSQFKPKLRIALISTGIITAVGICIFISLMMVNKANANSQLTAKKTSITKQPTTIHSTSNAAAAASTQTQPTATTSVQTSTTTSTKKSTASSSATSGSQGSGDAAVYDSTENNSGLSSPDGSSTTSQGSGTSGSATGSSPLSGSLPVSQGSDTGGSNTGSATP